MTTKHDIEEQLSFEADGGVLVECGVARGDGVAAMWAGTRRGRQLPIYAIDPYLPFRDELGAEYDDANLPLFRERTQDFAYRVTHVRATAEEVARDWTQPIALLWLDLSLSYDRLKAIIDAFEPHVIPGGLVAITGLEYPQLGTRQVFETLPKGPGWNATDLGGDKVAVLRKATPRRAVFYIAMGDSGRYVVEAQRSAHSVREMLPGVETFLFTTERVGEGFDHHMPLPARESEFWYLDCVRYFNLAVDTLGRNHEQLLYLDVDTRICEPCAELWHVLDRFDLALGHSASRDCVQSACGCPASFPTFQVGVNLFNVNRRTKELFARWLELYRTHPALYDENDEAPLRDALWQNDLGLEWVCLSPEWCLRFDFGAWVNGKVRVLHGRVGGRSQPSLKDVADEINQHTRMRLWDHGLVR